MGQTAAVAAHYASGVDASSSNLGMAMADISNEEWAEIKEAGGGLPEEARSEICSVVHAFREDQCREFEMRSWRTKKNVDDALALANELVVALDTLTRDENYRCYNTHGQPISAVVLAKTRDDAVELCGTLELDHERFKQKSRRERERMREIAFVRELLEIQQRHLNTRLPVQARETPTGVRFRQYIEKCSGGFALDAAVEAVTKEFARRKKTTGCRISSANVMSR